MGEKNGEQVEEFIDDLVRTTREVHSFLLDESGGVLARHAAALYAACARPFQSAFGEFVYPANLDKAAALLLGIVTGHVFVDGNKRTGTVTGVVLFMILEGIVTFPTELQVRLLGEVALETAKNGMPVAQVADWMRRIFAP